MRAISISLAALATLAIATLAAPARAQGMGSGGGGDQGSGTEQRLKPVTGAPGTIRIALEPTLDIVWGRGIGTAVADTDPSTSKLASRSYERMWEGGTGFGFSVYAPFEVIEPGGAMKEQAGVLIASILSTSLPGRASSFNGVSRKPGDLEMLSYTIGGGLRALTGGEDSPVRFLASVTLAIGGVQFSSVRLSAPSEPLFKATTGFALDARVRFGVDIPVSPNVSIGTTVQLGYLIAIQPDEASPIPAGWKDVSPDPVFLVFWGFALSTTIRF